MGRQKIVIKKIDDKQRKSVTFCKRREGLFKKAETASKMFGAQIGIITFSPAGKPFVFSTSNSSSLDSIIDTFMSSAASSSSMLLDYKRSRSSDGDDGHQFHETEKKKKNHKKQKTMMMDTTTITIPIPKGEEEEKDEGFQWNFDSDDQVLRNEIMGFGGNLMNQRIITEEMLLALQDGIGDETLDLDVATTCTVDDDYFDFSTLLFPPVDAELQEIHPNSSNVCEYVDHDDENGMCMSLLPPPMSTTTTSCNWRSHMNEEEEEVGGSDEYGLTIEEWEHVFSTTPSVVCNSTSMSSCMMNQEEGVVVGDEDGLISQSDWPTPDFLERLHS